MEELGGQKDLEAEGRGGGSSRGRGCGNGKPKAGGVAPRWEQVGETGARWVEISGELGWVQRRSPHGLSGT